MIDRNSAVEIKQTAAYIRINGQQSRAGELGVMSEQSGSVSRVWEALATPQTVESICSSLANDAALPAIRRDDVVGVMNRLFSQDLIELAPDS